ncbi:small conductance mechanosensitive channel [Kineosphaera limosa]|nr:mechanosensitive ion channel family protein [Kineosphaera limosa]NYE02745.1 small conductance mechanosensitive channel [Kineosphaera limosa]
MRLPMTQATPDPVVESVSGLSWERVGDWLLDAPLKILLIIVVAVIARWLAHRFIAGLVRALVARRQATTESGSIVVVDPVPTAQLPVMRRQARKAARALTQSGLVDTDRQRQRVETLGSVLRSITSVVIWSIAVLMIGAELGLNMTPILASAGVGGVALGFGAQSLVKDFLSGMFMILEDQYGVGDIVDTGDVVGTVEEVTLRVTRVRDMQGVVWYIRNGEIVRIANRSQGWQTGSVEVQVASDEDPERAIKVIRESLQGMEEEKPWSRVILEPPRVAGVESITGGTMTISVFVKCLPNEHWAVQREIRERTKIALAKAGIRGPILMPGGFPMGAADPTKPANPT